MGKINEVFQPFQVTVPEGRRYWEDDSTGVFIKKGLIVTINPRQFRSNELRFALLRSQVLMVEGECSFAFRDKLVNVKPGKGKNIIIDFDPITKENVDVKSKENNAIEEKIIQKHMVKKEPEKIVFKKESIKKVQEEENGKEIGQYSTEQFM